MLGRGFQESRVLVTGHTGFKGSWAVTLLQHLGAKVYGASIDVPDDERHIYHEYSVGSRLVLGERRKFDVVNRGELERLLIEHEFDYIFHFAAQAIVANSIQNPMKTFETNVIGFGNVLDLSRLYQPTATLILVTSDKCYDPEESALPYVESHRLGGEDPYSGSKAAAEILFASFVKTFDSKAWPHGVATVRAGNVFGGGDWSPKRLAPDIVRDSMNGRPTTLRLPNATRPWTYVLDVLYGYFLLALKLQAGEAQSGQSWNFASGEKLTVRDFAQKFATHLDARIESASQEEFDEVGFLELDASKARSEIGWKPQVTLEAAIDITSQWYSDSGFRANLPQLLKPYLTALGND